MIKYLIIFCNMNYVNLNKLLYNLFKNSKKLCRFYLKFDEIDTGVLSILNNYLIKTFKILSLVKLNKSLLGYVLSNFLCKNEHIFSEIDNFFLSVYAF